MLSRNILIVSSALIVLYFGAVAKVGLNGGDKQGPNQQQLFVGLLLYTLRLPNKKHGFVQFYNGMLCTISL